MTRTFRRSRKVGFFICAGIAVAAGLAIAIAAPHATRAQAPAPAPPVAAPVAAPAAAVKTAGEVFMNVTVLKDAPADQLISAMEFMSTSLGQPCTFCHVIPHFQDDSKKPKATARQMIQMEMDINKTNFSGRAEVTCNTCHRGTAHPLGVPVIPEETQMAASMPSAPTVEHAGPTGTAAPPNVAGAPVGSPAAAPTVDQILDKYTQAIGGADAIAKLTSRKAEGTGTFEGGGASEAVTIEIIQEAPNKRRMSLAGKDEAFTEGTDGTDFWQQDAKGQVSDVQGTQFAELNRAADMSRLLDVRKHFTQLRVMPNLDQVGDHKVYVVMGVPADGGPRERLLFDIDSGLLLRYVFAAPSPIGNNPVEADFSDYRAVGGLKLPFTVRTATPDAALTVHFSQIQINVPADDSKFAKPATAPAPAATPPAKQ
jgi:outer membrane lipoprotein-sorting protein